MPLPQLYILGAPKCGTSAVYDALARHPEVNAPPTKEPHFFADELEGFSQVANRDEYEALYARPGYAHKLGVDGSTMYLFATESARRILDAVPDARFVVLLRNPVDLVHSFHSHLCYLRHENIDDFETAWRAQGDRRRGQRLPPGITGAGRLQYEQVGALGTQLARLYDIVPSERVWVGLLESLNATPRRLLQQICEHSGINPALIPEPERVNDAKHNRLPMLASLLRIRPAPIEWAYQQIRQRLGVHGFGIGNRLLSMQTRAGRASRLSTALREELVAHFSCEIASLEQLLSRDLSHWRA